MLNGETLGGLQSDLDRDRDKVAHLLAVLQRLDADRPPPWRCGPDDSLGAARGAMQLRGCSSAHLHGDCRSCQTTENA